MIETLIGLGLVIVVVGFALAADLDRREYEMHREDRINAMRALANARDDEESN